MTKFKFSFRRKTACMYGLQQRLQHIKQFEYSQTNTFRGKAAPVSALWEEVHGQFESVLP